MTDPRCRSLLQEHHVVMVKYKGNPDPFNELRYWSDDVTVSRSTHVFSIGSTDENNMFDVHTNEGVMLFRDQVHPTFHLVRSMCEWFPVVPCMTATRRWDRHSPSPYVELLDMVINMDKFPSALQDYPRSTT